MGTKIQSKAYLPGYCSTRDLNDNIRNRIWPLCHDNRTMANNQCDTLLPQQLVDRYLGYEKEKIRQTILQQELIFRDQLQELHRLYRQQRDLMNEIKGMEMYKNQKEPEASPSRTLFSRICPEDAKSSSHFPPLTSVFTQLPTSGTISRIFPLSSIQGKSMNNHFQSKETDFSKDSSMSFPRRMFDLEISADGCMNKEDKQFQQRLHGESVAENVASHLNHEVSRDVNSSPVNPMKRYSNGDAFSCLLEKTCNLADLNEPLPIEETSLSASCDHPGNITCHEDMQKGNGSVNAYSNFHFASKEFPWKSLEGRIGGNCLNDRQPGSETKRKEQLPNAVKAGDSSENFSTIFKQSNDQAKQCKEISSQATTEHSGKKRIFGVDISENYETMVGTSNLPNIISKSALTNAETSSSLSLKKTSWIEGNCVATSESSVRRKSVEFLGEVHIDEKKSVPISKCQVSYQNGLCYIDDRQVLNCSSKGLDCTFSSPGTNTLVPKQLLNHDSIENTEGIYLVDWKIATGMRINMGTPFMSPNEVVHKQNALPGDHQSKQGISGGALLCFVGRPKQCVQEISSRGNSYHMNLDSLQNCANFFRKAEKAEGFSQISNPKEEIASVVITKDSDRKIESNEVSDCVSSKKILGIPILNALNASKDLNVTGPISQANVDGDIAKKPMAGEAVSGKPFDPEHVLLQEGLHNYISGLRHQIDLNLSLNEEESPSTPSLPTAIVKIATSEIDLEAPAVLEPDVDICPEFDKSDGNLSIHGSKEPHEEVRVAAETIVAISLSSEDSFLDNPSHKPLEDASSDYLGWLAEIVSSHNVDLERKLRDVSLCMESGCNEDCIPKGMDYFEFMTLNLKDSTEEYDYYKQPMLENQSNEETVASALPKRPRRGQATRGRQRKDFQRDILPGLISLSKHEVTEDIQTFEEIFRAQGCTWQTTLSKRNAAKNGRGRRRSGGPARSPAMKAACPPPTKQPLHQGLGLEERSLSGWGKRTRRLPRQRCPTGSSVLPLK